MARQTTPHFQERAASQTLGLHRCSVGDEALLSVRVLNLEQPNRLWGSQRFGGAEDRLKPVKHTCSLSVRSERKSRLSSLPNVHVDRPRRANASQRSGRTCC